MGTERNRRVRRRRRTAAATLGLLTAVGLFLTVALAGPAEAHATLIGTSPGDDELIEAVPEVVDLTFDEGVEVTDNSVRIVGPDGRDVQDGSPTVSDDSTTVSMTVGDDVGQEGTYTVDWRVTSFDSHVITGNFLFHVGERTGAADLSDDGDRAAELVGFHGRWLAYVGSVAAVGASALAVAVPGAAAAQRRWRKVVVGGAAAAVLGVVLALVSRAAEVAGESLADAVARMPGAVTDARSTELLAWRLVPLLAMVALASAPRVWRRLPVAPLLAGVLAVIVASLGGHAWTADLQWLAVASDAVHFGVVSAWAGGLLALLVALPVIDSSRTVAERFSALALITAVAAAVAGTVLGWEHLDGLGELTSTSYGRYLLAKVLFFSVLVGLGWLNRYRLVPLAERTVEPLRRSLRVELVVVVMVLGLTAGLVDTAPGEADAPDGEPFSGRVEGDASETEDPAFAAELQLDVVPAQVGDNELHLNFYDADGEPLPVLVVRAEVAAGGQSPRGLEIDLLSPNHAFADGVSLPSPGDWTVEVTALPEDLGEPVLFTFEVPIS